jgi:mono/diheme cytochrome c family protein
VIVLMAVTAALVARSAAAQTPADRGKQVYEKWCTPCHGAGDGKPGTISAQALYKGSKPAVLADRTDLTAAGIKTAVRSGVYIMPRFRKTEVTDTELDGIIAYLTRTSR